MFLQSGVTEQLYSFKYTKYQMLGFYLYIYFNYSIKSCSAHSNMAEQLQRLAGVSVYTKSSN